MVRNKNVPSSNVQEMKLKDFFKEAVHSTLNSDESCSSEGSSSEEVSSSSSSGKSTSQKSSSPMNVPQDSDNKRRKPGEAALQEIRKLQRSTELLIPRAAFIRVIRDVLVAEEQRRKSEGENGLHGLRFTAEALECLQEATEIQLTNFFTMSYYCTLHARRKTLMVRDCQLARFMLGRNHPLNP